MNHLYFSTEDRGCPTEQLRYEKRLVDWYIKYGFNMFDMDELVESAQASDKEFLQEFAGLVSRSLRLKEEIHAMEMQSYGFSFPIEDVSPRVH